MKTKVVTELVRFSYVNVFEPYSYKDQRAKYSVHLIIQKNDKITINKINYAVNSVIEENKNSMFGGKTNGLRLPIRDGSEKEDEAYEGNLFVVAKSLYKPQIVDAQLNEILDRNEFYSGCYGKASLIFFTYNEMGNRGVACGLQNLQKLKDGKRLDGLDGTSGAASDFSIESEYINDDFIFV